MSSHELRRRWQLERWISWVRVAAVPWAFAEVGIFSTGYPSRSYELAAWGVTLALALGAAFFFWVDRRPIAARLQPGICLAGLAFDTGVIWAYALVYTFEPGTPIRPRCGSGRTSGGRYPESVVTVSVSGK